MIRARSILEYIPEILALAGAVMGERKADHLGEQQIAYQSQLDLKHVHAQRPRVPLRYTPAPR